MDNSSGAGKSALNYELLCMLILKFRSCSLANFGVQSFNHEVIGELVPLVDKNGNATDYLCPDKPRAILPRKIKQVIPPKSSRQRWWKSFGFSSQQDEIKENHRARDVNEILLCLRGSCLFEEKSSTAQTLGAKGLIVANSEVSAS
jgi:hypothetical protein